MPNGSIWHENCWQFMKWWWVFEANFSKNILRFQFCKIFKSSFLILTNPWEVNAKNAKKIHCERGTVLYTFSTNTFSTTCISIEKSKFGKKNHLFFSHYHPSQLNTIVIGFQFICSQWIHLFKLQPCSASLALRISHIHMLLHIFSCVTVDQLIGP